MKIIDLHIHLTNSNTQQCLNECECDFISSDETSLRLRAKGIVISCIMRSPRLQHFSKIKNKQANTCIAVEILTIEMYMQALETFSLLKHQSNSINPLITLLDLF